VKFDFCNAEGGRVVKLAKIEAAARFTPPMTAQNKTAGNFAGRFGLGLREAYRIPMPMNGKFMPMPGP
jgi:hypothetical protein